jgi:glycosyltransferase involved in cell wall biosynthesis
VLLVPSIVREGLPRVAVEAMMCAIPVLASGYGVRAEVIGAGGIMVEDYSNPSAWVDALGQLDDPSRYEALSEAALAHAAGYDSVAGARPLTALLQQITACGSLC